MTLGRTWLYIFCMMTSKILKKKKKNTISTSSLHFFSFSCLVDLKGWKGKGVEIRQAAGRKGQNERTFREINVIKDGYLCLLHGVQPRVGESWTMDPKLSHVSVKKRTFPGKEQKSREIAVSPPERAGLFQLQMSYSVDTLQKISFHT